MYRSVSLNNVPAKFRPTEACKISKFKIWKTESSISKTILGYECREAHESGPLADSGGSSDYEICGDCFPEDDDCCSCLLKDLDALPMVST